jgi:hypothetical protein
MGKNAGEQGENDMQIKVIQQSMKGSYHLTDLSAAFKTTLK